MVPVLEQLATSRNVARFRETTIPICERRRMFLTLNGFLGIGPDCAQEGDIVAVLSGGDLPFILRPIRRDADAVADTDQLAGLYYHLIGECNIEGLMHGEIIQA
jgi:hypothetical protein